MRSAVRRIYRSALERRTGSAPEAFFRRRAMVFAPHQDDETLGCGGVIALKRRAGAEVFVVFMCDGTRSHSNVATAESMKKVRRFEALAACRALGVEPHHVAFLDAEEAPKDSDSSHITLRAADFRLQISSLLAEHMPEDVIIPYGLDQHIDHRATNSLVLDALRDAGRGATVLEYPIWHWQHWPWTRPILRNGMLGRVQRVVTPVRDVAASGSRFLRHLNFRVDITEAVETKREALSRHRSQVTRLIDTPRWRTLYDVSDGEFVALFFDRFEFYRIYEVNWKGRVGPSSGA